MRSPVNLLAGAVGLSALGDFLALVPLALLLERETGSGFAVAGLFVALWSPAIVLAGPAGLLVDRIDPRRVLVAASVVQAAVGRRFPLRLVTTSGHDIGGRRPGGDAVGFLDRLAMLDLEPSG
ncbi:MAG: hypothetical protein M3320_08760, partial [Actinomycetota bacterium]|nr:hypothetical protein [Actinomycetota bacterium]